MIETYRLTLTALVSESTGDALNTETAEDKLTEALGHDTSARAAVMGALRKLYGDALADGAFVIKLESVHLDSIIKET